MHSMTALHPLIAYGWYWGWWWWWWLVILFFLWWLLLPPFSYGRRWYGGYRSRSGVGAGAGYPEGWQAIESRFIESPAAGVAEADRVVGALMSRARPSTGMAEEYRDAHAVTIKAQTGTATLDEMRTAMLTYRGLFDRLTPMA